MITFMQSYHLVKIQIQHFILQRHMDAIKCPLSLVLCEEIPVFMNTPSWLGWLTKYVKEQIDEVHHQMTVSTYYYETPAFVLILLSSVLSIPKTMLTLTFLLDMHISVLVGSLVVVRAIFKMQIHLLLV